MGKAVLAWIKIGNIRQLLAGLFLGVCGLQDFRSRRISLASLAVFGCSALAFALYACRCGISDVPQCLTALVPGAFLLGLAYAAKGAAGKGDGICFMLLGPVLGARETLLVLALALFLASVCGLALLAVRKADRKTRLPFLVFAAVAWAVLSVSGTGFFAR